MLSKISRRILFLIFLDFLAIVGTHMLAFYIEADFHFFKVGHYPFLILSCVTFILLFYIFDLYYPFKYFKVMPTLVDVSSSVLIGTLLLAAACYFDHTIYLRRSIFFSMMLLLSPSVFGIRICYDILFRSRFLDKKALILGTGPLACEIAKVMKQIPHSGMEVVGLVHESRKPAAAQKDGIPIVGGLHGLISLIDWYGVQMVVLAFDSKENETSEAVITSELLRRQVTVTSAIHLFERLTGDIPYRLLGSHYCLGLMAHVRMRPYLKLKRILDVLFSVILFALLSPFFLLAFIVLFFSKDGPVFFNQERIGKNGAPFRLFKFRSMKKLKKGKLVVTSFGRWMRRYRVDEIPQLINVVKGDMSLIGPRPEIPYFVKRCREKIPFYDAVFTVKPGLTGWAQVKFRYTTSVKDYDRKFRYNLYYLKNISLPLDLQILLMTIRVVLLGKGK